MQMEANERYTSQYRVLLWLILLGCSLNPWIAKGLAQDKAAVGNPGAAPAVPAIPAAPAAAWPMFRGNSAMTGLAATPLPEPLQLLWTFKAEGPIESTPAIAENGQVFVGTTHGHFYCLSLADGKQVWRWFRGMKPEDFIPGILSSPCLTPTAVCFGDEDGDFWALQQDSGAVQWQTTIGGPIASSPNFYQGKIYVGTDEGYVVGLDANKGHILFKAEAPNRIPASLPWVDGKLVVCGCDGFLQFLSADDGRVVSSMELGGNFASTPAIRVAADSKALFIGNMDGAVYRINLTDMNAQWQFRDEKRSFSFLASPALSTDLVLIGGQDKQMHALRQSDGVEVWRFPTRGRIDGSAVVAGDVVYFGSADGKLYGVGLTDGKKRWEFTAGPDIKAGPAVAQECLLVGDMEGHLYCFGAKSQLKKSAPLD